jgi:hypothetical protein
MNTQGFGCIDYLPEWKKSILRWITETVMTKLNKDNVIYVKKLYKLWLPGIILILVGKDLTYILNGSQ